MRLDSFQILYLPQLTAMEAPLQALFTGPLLCNYDRMSREELAQHQESTSEELNLLLLAAYLLLGSS